MITAELYQDHVMHLSDAFEQKDHTPVMGQASGTAARQREATCSESDEGFHLRVGLGSATACGLFS